MKILVTGYNGQLGYDVVNELHSRGIEAKGVDINDFDLTDETQVINYVNSYHPDAVIHCAAFTAVDKAEDCFDKCREVNEGGTRNIAKACNQIDAKLLYISTDYVYNGDGDQPFTPDSPTAPVNKYGESKFLGEIAAKDYVEKLFIVRISWVFGKNGNNFIRTMLKIGLNNDNVTVVDDQIGSPTYTIDLSVLLADMIQTEKYGTYCATNEGYCSWADFAKEIYKCAGFNVKVIPVSTEEYLAMRPQQAKRPKNSRMSKMKLSESGFKSLPSWQDALSRYVNEVIGEYKNA